MYGKDSESLKSYKTILSPIRGPNQKRGDIIITKDRVIDRIPIGRKNKNNENTTSIFRFYLLARNSIRLFSGIKTSIKSLCCIPCYSFKGLIFGQNIHYLGVALFSGIINGIKNNLCVTKTLKFFRPDLNDHVSIECIGGFECQIMD